jgi:N-acetylglucosaminyldiphosphoundecaprenol N-acetyl-beta-D-mannosaminyltransferase
LQIVCTCVLPLAISARSMRQHAELDARSHLHGEGMTLNLSDATAGDKVVSLVPFIRQVLKDHKWVKLELAGVDQMDGRFFGALICVRKQLRHHGLSLTMTGVSPRLRRVFRLNRFEFLLAHG